MSQHPAHHDLPVYAPSFDEVMSVADTRGGSSISPEQWEGLVGFWRPFSGCQGGKIWDLSGNGLHATLSTDAFIAAGWKPNTSFGSATLKFSGAEYASCPAGQVNLSAKACTACIWVRGVLATGQAWFADPVSEILMGIGSFVTGAYLATKCNGDLETMPPLGLTASPDRWLTNQWQMFAIQYNADRETPRGFGNGRFLGNNNGSQRWDNDQTNITIGANHNAGSYERYANMEIGEIRIYDHKKSASEIMDMFMFPTAAVTQRAKVYSYGSFNGAPVVSARVNRMLLEPVIWPT